MACPEGKLGDAGEGSGVGFGRRSDGDDAVVTGGFALEVELVGHREERGADRQQGDEYLLEQVGPIIVTGDAPVRGGRCGLNSWG